MEARPDRNSVSSHPLYALLGSTKFSVGRIKILEAVCRYAADHVGMKEFAKFPEAMHATRFLKTMGDRKKAEHDALCLATSLFQSLTKKDRTKLTKSINGDIDEMYIYDVEKNSAKRRFEVLLNNTVSKTADN